MGKQCTQIFTYQIKTKMHQIIYKLKDFWQTVTMNEFARQLWLHPEQLRRNKLDYTDEHKKLLQEYLDGRIRELVKIKVLLDKEIQWQ